MMNNFSSFNVKQFFEDYDIEYHKSGEKNVTRGWVNINCPFCSDPSWHCGINLKSKFFNCFSCHKKGGSNYLVKILLQCTTSKAEFIIKKYSTDLESYEDDIVLPATEVFLPEEAISKFPPLHLNYLKSRSFGLGTIKKYNLKACYQFGKYSYRIIIPFYYKKKLITFTTRDVTGKSDKKYLNAPSEKSIYKTTDTFYNIDNVFSDSVLIVEGTTDVWRIGNNSVALSTTAISHHQIKMLINKRIKRAVVLLDPNQEDNAERIGARLSMFMDTKIFLLDEEDPADMNEKQIKEIRRLI